MRGRHPTKLSRQFVTIAHGGARLTPMEPMSSGSARCPNSVLIVDQSEESRDVIRTILEPRGINILEAEGADRGLELLREEHPRVVVLDLEIGSGEGNDLQTAFEDESRVNETSLVMLGKVKRVDRSAGNPVAQNAPHVIAKPYHYGPLIRTIEQLLQEPKAAA